MNAQTLAEVFDTVYLQELSEFDSAPRHFFSLRHRRQMKKILYPNTVYEGMAKRGAPLKKRLLIALLVIILSLIGIVAGAQISKSFAFDEIGGHTYLFAVNDKNAPATIDALYHLPTVPAEFETLYESLGTYNVLVMYIDADGRSFFFDQSVKNGFSIEYDEEQSCFEEIKIGGNFAYYICLYDKGGMVVWDNEDYILEVGGNFTKDELIAFAESVELKCE